MSASRRRIKDAMAPALLNPLRETALCLVWPVLAAVIKLGENKAFQMSTASSSLKSWGVQILQDKSPNSVHQLRSPPIRRNMAELA